MTKLNLELIARAGLQDGLGGKVYFVSVYRDPMTDTYSTYGHNGGYGKTLVEQPKLMGVSLSPALLTARKLYQQKAKSPRNSYTAIVASNYLQLRDIDLSDPPITSTHVNSLNINDSGHPHDRKAEFLKSKRFIAPKLDAVTPIAFSGKIFSAVKSSEKWAAAVTYCKLAERLPAKRVLLHLTRTSLGVLQRLFLEDGTELQMHISKLDAIMLPFPEWSHMVFDCLYSLDSVGFTNPFIADVLAYPNVDISSLDFLERNSFLQETLAPVSQMLLPWAFTKKQKSILEEKPGEVRSYYFSFLAGKLTSSPMMEADTIDEFKPA